MITVANIVDTRYDIASLLESRYISFVLLKKFNLLTWLTALNSMGLSQTYSVTFEFTDMPLYIFYVCIQYALLKARRFTLQFLRDGALDWGVHIAVLLF